MVYNRLHEGMPLGIDATTRFATGNYTEPLTESELAIDSPYNTRTNTGLPPGPINSPGLASIEAAAHPAKTDYLFYVVEPGTSLPSPRPKPNSTPTSNATTRLVKRPVAIHRTAARNRRAAARRPRFPGWPLALARDAKRGAG